RCPSSRTPCPKTLTTWRNLSPGRGPPTRHWHRSGRGPCPPVTRIPTASPPMTRTTKRTRMAPAPGVGPRPVSAADGLVIVDKPGGRPPHAVGPGPPPPAGPRRVGHGGTLDPMATGVLVAGIGKATRLLGHLTLAEKEYLATIRLGQATDTCEAEG